MTAAKRTRKKPATKKGKTGKKPAARRSLWPVAIALMVPAVLVGGYMAYHSNPAFANMVDNTGGKVRGFVGNLFEGHDKGKASARDEARPKDERQQPVAGPTDRRHLPALADEKSPEIPRQTTPMATSSLTPLTVKQAQKLATKLFGGEIKSSRTEPRAFWYDFVMTGGKKFYPFDTAPTQVSIATVALAGQFVKDIDGHLLFVKVVNPGGAEWTNEYAGAILLSGTLADPGKVVGATAMQAPRGVVTRYEALDVQRDGILELVLEVESEAPGGYLFRDLAVHAFSGSGTRMLWTARTLDDGPGVPLETARFKNVVFKDLDGDDVLDIEVEIGKRLYRIRDDFTRKLTVEQTVAVRKFQFTRGKFRLASK